MRGRSSRDSQLVSHCGLPDCELNHRESTTDAARRTLQQELAPFSDHCECSTSADEFTVAGDGSRFRIYRIGSLDVRTITEPDCVPVVGPIFSVLSPTDGKPADPEQEEIVKATEYVERVSL